MVEGWRRGGGAGGTCERREFFAGSEFSRRGGHVARRARARRPLDERGSNLTANIARAPRLDYQGGRRRGWRLLISPDYFAPRRTWAVTDVAALVRQPPSPARPTHSAPARNHEGSRLRRPLVTVVVCGRPRKACMLKKTSLRHQCFLSLILHVSSLIQQTAYVWLSQTLHTVNNDANVYSTIYREPSKVRKLKLEKLF